MLEYAPRAASSGDDAPVVCTTGGVVTWFCGIRSGDELLINLSGSNIVTEFGLFTAKASKLMNLQFAGPSVRHRLSCRVLFLCIMLPSALPTTTSTRTKLRSSVLVVNVVDSRVLVGGSVI